MPEKNKKRYGRKSNHNIPVLAGLVALGLAGGVILTKLSPSNAEQAVNITIDTDLESRLISDVMQKYIDRFGCRNDVTLSFGTIDQSHLFQPKQADIMNISPETAGPGWITLDRIAIAKASNEVGGTSISYYDLVKHFTAHAMTHACIPSEPTYLDSPYIADEIGNEVIGYQGLSAVIRMADGTQTNITSFEESVADILAEEITGFSHIESGYSPMGIITRHFMKKRDITSNMLASFVQSNDIINFVAAILGKNSLETTETDIRSLLFAYNSVHQGLTTPEEAIAFVEANSQ